MKLSNSENSDHTKCPGCQSRLTNDAVAGLCPSCLMAAAMTNEKNERETLPRFEGFNAPGPEELSRWIEGVKVQELLGHGGMGAVYRAVQINLDRPVAIKILAPRLSNDPSFAERFAREARTLAKLNHPNIVTVYDSGRAGEYYYLLMELIEGVNLRDAIESGGVTPDEALMIIPRICDALQYAHDQGVVHRDIKPENILIGMNDQVKIADFGLAKMLDEGVNDFTLTATRQVLGTRNYMAPEQIEKPSTVDHRADIYSLGVVFYELLTGELPLGRFSLPSEKAAVDDDTDQVVLRTLEKEPVRRFQQASEVRTAVESIDLANFRNGIQEDVESPLTPFNGIEARHNSAAESAPPNPNREENFTTRPSKRWSLPFKNDKVHGGLSQLHGIAHVGEKELEIEFRVHKLGVAKSAPRKVSIPYYELLTNQINLGWSTNTMEIQSKRLEVFDEIPGTKQGRFMISFDKNLQQQASEFKKMLDVKTTEASPEGRAKNAAANASSLAHVPFKIRDVHGGFAEAFGISKVTQDYLVVEFEIKDCMGVIKTAPTTILIPVDDVIAVQYKSGVVNDKIEVQTNNLDSVATIPNSTQGKFYLRTKKREQDKTKNWARQAMRVCGLPITANLIETKPESSEEKKEALRRRLQFPRIGLAMVVVLSLIWMSLAIWTIGFCSRNEDVIRDYLVQRQPVDFRYAKETQAGEPKDLPIWAPLAATLYEAFDLDERFVRNSDPFRNNEQRLFSLLAISWFGVIAPALSILIASTILLLTGRLQLYWVAIVGCVLLMIPAHVGWLVTMPVAIWILMVLLKPANRATYVGSMA